MPWIMVDVEADGPVPGLYSMICFGAVVVDDNLDKTFYGQLKPISDNWIPEALKVSGFTREETLYFRDTYITMRDFDTWLYEVTDGYKSRPKFVSDNNGFDWAFINYYFEKYLKNNPFGHSSTNLGSLYKGMKNSMFVNFKHLRKTKHTHHPVDDAMGNAEALLHLKNEMGLKINLD